MKSIAAYDLAARRSNTIGIIVNKLDTYFVTSVLKAIQKVTLERGYDLLITHSQESLGKEIANARFLFDQRVDGVLASPCRHTKNDAHFTRFISNGIPVVFFDRATQARTGDSVVVDNAKCGVLAAEHLIAQGCRRIAIVTSNLERTENAQRFNGFCETLRTVGLPLAAEFLIEGDIGTENGIEAAQRILAMHSLPDGLFITDDLAAVVCIHALQESRVDVPGDIAVVGFRNDPLARMITPALTTIDYPAFDLGETAACTLLDNLCGKNASDLRITAVLPPELIVRNSSLRRQAG